MNVSDKEIKYVSRFICHSEGLDPDEVVSAGDPDSNHAMLMEVERWELYKRDARRAIAAFNGIMQFREYYP